MSKAFTSDSDGDDIFIEPPALPPGVINYMTVAGAKKLQAEIDNLMSERSHVGSDIKGSDRAQSIERRLRYLLPRRDAMQAINPLSQPKDRVLFGASVTISDDKSHQETWRIVGLDEVDLDRGWISWMSPLASALLDKKVGDDILFRSQHLTILSIRYEA